VRQSLQAAFITAALLAGLTPSPATADADPRRFFGTYVGRAEEVNPADRTRMERHVDLVIKPQGTGRLLLTWTNVTLVDGRRDVPGVRRHTDQTWLIPLRPEQGLYRARVAYDPFTEDPPPDVAAGDPLRWGVLSDDSLRVYSFVVLGDGRYELQVYTRTLTSAGMRLDWKRLVDGEPTRHMTGDLVRTD
jgi:hypothetical protein